MRMFSEDNTMTLVSDIEDNLLVASRDGDLIKVKNLVKQLQLSKPNSVNCRNIAGNTPLCLAVMKGHIEIVKFLVDNGADINNLSNYSSSPFNEACLNIPPYVDNERSSQSLNNFEEILKIFLAKGFDLNATSGRSKSYLGNLANVGAIDAMKILVRYGANIDIRDQFDFTLLHCAAIKGHFHNEQLEVAKWLIDMGADVHASTYNGKTALDLAKESSHQAIVNLLAPKLNITIKAIWLK